MVLLGEFALTASRCERVSACCKSWSALEYVIPRATSLTCSLVLAARITLLMRNWFRASSLGFKSSVVTGARCSRLSGSYVSTRYRFIAPPDCGFEHNEILL